MEHDNNMTQFWWFKMRPHSLSHWLTEDISSYN